MACNIGPSILSLEGVITMTERPHGGHDDESQDLAIAGMTEEQRRERIAEAACNLPNGSRSSTGCSGDHLSSELLIGSRIDIAPRAPKAGSPVTQAVSCACK